MNTLEIFNLTAAAVLIALTIIAGLRERRARQHAFDLADAIHTVRVLHDTGIDEFRALRDHHCEELRNLKTRHEDDLVALIQRHDRFARGNLEQAQRMNELTAAKIVQFNEQQKNQGVEVYYQMANPLDDPAEFAEMVEQQRRREQAANNVFANARKIDYLKNRNDLPQQQGTKTKRGRQ